MKTYHTIDLVYRVLQKNW